MLKNALVPVACVFIGWLLGLLSEHWAEKRRSRERFAEAIRRIREELSLRSDNLDNAFIEWHAYSVRFLRPPADYLQITQPKRWDKIKQTWNEYALPDQEKTIATFLTRKITRTTLEEKLNDLLKTVMDS